MNCQILQRAIWDVWKVDLMLNICPGQSLCFQLNLLCCLSQKPECGGEGHQRASVIQRGLAEKCLLCVAVYTELHILKNTVDSCILTSGAGVRLLPHGVLSFDRSIPWLLLVLLRGKSLFYRYMKNLHVTMLTFYC